ncbi:hypothetical protein SDJN03_07235, partial [Cucurbita argyrosperma subsp. sororia]
MGSHKISMALPFFLALLLVAFTVSAADISASFQKPHIRKLSMEYTTVEKAALRAKPAVYDFPWKGGYHPPANDR